MRTFLILWMLTSCAGVVEAPDEHSNPAPNPNPNPTPPPPSGTHEIVGYFAAWGVYGRNYHVPQIPADQVTTINYAFANLSGGHCVLGDSYADTDKFYPGDTWDAGALRGSFHQLQILKAAHPNLRTLISVGGWTWSGGFSDAAASDESRREMASSCVAFMKQYGFDGIDIDWEYPVSGGLNPGRPEDRHNFTLLLQELRRQLDVDGVHHLLTIAAPAGMARANLEIADVAAAVDRINLMSYDFHGGWEYTTGFNAGMTDVDDAVRAYLDAGVPPTKLVVGVPFYGRGWQGVPQTNDGLNQPATGIPMGTSRCTPGCSSRKK